MNKITTLIITLLTLLFSQNQLIIPDTLTGNNIYLSLGDGTHQFYNGINTTTMGANGGILGPTLILNKGDAVDITVENQLSDTTTIHWHGMHVSAENDGGPHTTIPPSATWNPKFTVLDKAGTYWYHPHLHEKTNFHVTMGIAGFIIVRDSEEAQLNLPRTYGVDDFPLAIQTKNFDLNKQIIFPSNTDSVVMVNATIDAELEIPAQIVRLRLLNGSSQRVFNIGLTNSLEFYQIGSDGGLLEKPIVMNRLQLASGERAEILVDLSGKEVQTIELLSYASELPNGIYGAAIPGIAMGMGFGLEMDGYNPNPLNGNDFKIMQFKVTNPTVSPITSIPSMLVNVEPILESEATLTRTLTLSPEMGNMGQGMGMDVLNGKFLINNQSFDMDVINYDIPFNNTEIWSITNMSPIGHPFHIHDVQFYILDRNGNSPPLNEQGRKDVVFVNPMETVRFITKFDDFANSSVPYMYHCHMLTHEDDGMMGQFIVTDPTVGVDNEDESNLLQNFSINSVYPNPFNPNTKIVYQLDKSGLVNISIFDLRGRLIADLLNQHQNPGQYNIVWEGINQTGKSVPSGVYIAKLSLEGASRTEKLMLMK